MQHLRLHPLASVERARAVAQHPATGTSAARSPATSPATSPAAGTAPAAGQREHVTLQAVPDRTGEDGSLVTEYGLLAVVAATVAGVVIQWASNGALVDLFNALLEHARSLVGA